MSEQDSKISRRTLLKGGAALTFVVMLDSVGCKREVKKADRAAKETSTVGESRVGAWVVVHDDDRVTIFNPAAEMGQGSMTALPLILAEEMDADWSKVSIENSPVEPEIYGRSGGYGGGGSMMTVGSRAVMGYFTQLRLAGAQIRLALIEMAAAALEVPATELTTEPGVVVHAKSKRRVTFGELAVRAKTLEDLPEVDEKDLKSPADFRLIGTSMPRHDIPPKTDGSAVYAIDVRLEGMLYGMIERSPIHDDQVNSYNKDEVRGVSGVVTTVELDYGVGVIAETVEAAFAARNALKIEWANEAKAVGFHSEKALANYPSVIDENSIEARSYEDRGDAADAFESASKKYEADYYADTVYHGQMEPLNAVVWAKGDEAEVWIGTQGPAVAKGAVAGVLGIQAEKITMHRTYLGGGFGRRSSPDYVVEAAHLAKAVDKPVKLIWTRQDDVKWGKFRPMCLQRMRAGVDEDGKVTAWMHHLVGDGGRLLGSGVDIPYYDIPNQRIDLREVEHGIRTHYWRSVGHHYNKFAIEAFVDELATGEGVDPLEFRRSMIASPEARAVLDRIAEMSNWGSNTEGRAKGIALIERSDTLAAAVAEISVDRDDGKIRVHRFWAALDAGIVVQPDNAAAQIEGSIVMGLSASLTERITIKDGEVQQSNFLDYPIMRMSEIPEIEVHFIESENPPTGIGEPGVPLTAAAVANAFGTLTGARLRHMPFTAERVKSVLRGRTTRHNGTR